MVVAVAVLLLFVEVWMGGCFEGVFQPKCCFLHQNSHFLMSSLTNDPHFMSWKTTRLALRLSDEDMTKVALNALRQRLNALEAAQAEARRQQRQAEEAWWVFGASNRWGCLGELGANIKDKTILWTHGLNKRTGKQCDDIRRDWNKSVCTKKTCNSKVFQTTSHQATLSPAIMEVKKGWWSKGNY